MKICKQTAAAAVLILATACGGGSKWNPYIRFDEKINVSLPDELPLCLSEARPISKLSRAQYRALYNRLTEDWNNEIREYYFKDIPLKEGKFEIAAEVNCGAAFDLTNDGKDNYIFVVYWDIDKYLIPSNEVHVFSVEKGHLVHNGKIQLDLGHGKEFAGLAAVFPGNGIGTAIMVKYLWDTVDQPAVSLFWFREGVLEQGFFIMGSECDQKERDCTDICGYMSRYCENICGFDLNKMASSEIKVEGKGEDFRILVIDYKVENCELKKVVKREFHAVDGEIVEI